MQRKSQSVESPEVTAPGSGNGELPDNEEPSRVVEKQQDEADTAAPGPELPHPTTQPEKPPARPPPSSAKTPSSSQSSRPKPTPITTPFTTRRLLGPSLRALTSDSIRSSIIPAQVSSPLVNISQRARFGNTNGRSKVLNGSRRMPVEGDKSGSDSSSDSHDDSNDDSSAKGATTSSQIPAHRRAGAAL